MIKKLVPGCNTMHDLSDATLLRVFLHVPLDQRRKLPMVCKKWSRVCQSEELWAQVQVSLGADFLQHVNVAALYRWFLARDGLVTHLEFEISSPDAWNVIHGVLGMVGRQLQHLRVYGDAEGCYEPGGRAAWMALVPCLTSLELENSADWTIGTCRFPPGLSHLDLSYCGGEEAMSTVPEHVGSLRSLVSLSLQGSQLEGGSGSELLRLQGCTQLQRLNLSDCCLEEVPSCLAALAGHLTSLTLNTNAELGGDDNAGRVAALASLTRLAALEMRECELASVPVSVTRLTSLRTLLLGLNDMTSTPFVLPGPYLGTLKMLGLSDCFDEDSGVTLEMVIRELEGATGLEVLRINRNMGLVLHARGLHALLLGKPSFKRLDFSEDMAAPDLNLAAFQARFPGVSFRAVD